MSIRILRVNSLIRDELSRIMLRELSLESGVLVTITEVISSPDLRECKVFLSILPEEKKEQTLLMVQRKIYYLQQKLNARLRMRPIPKIEFVYDKKAEQAARVEAILDRLKKKEQ